MMSKFRLIVTAIALLGTVGPLSSCGGGGGGGTAPVPPLGFSPGEAAVVVVSTPPHAARTSAAAMAMVGMVKRVTARDATSTSQIPDPANPGFSASRSTPADRETVEFAGRSTGR